MPITMYPMPKIREKLSAIRQCITLEMLPSSRIYVSNVDFDVAINIQDSQSKTGGANIEVFSVLNIGGKGEKGLIDTSTNRIKFTLPLALPTEPEDKHFTTRLTPPKRPELK